MTALPNRRKRRILAAIVADPYRKLAAIGLAMGLWYFLNLQLEQTKVVTFELVTTPTGSGQIHVDFGDERIVETGFMAGGQPLPDRRVQVTFTGPSAEVEALQGKPPDLRVDLSDRVGDGAPREFVEFDVDKLIKPGTMRGVALSMDPPLIRVNIDRLSSLPITLDLDRHLDLQIDDEEVERRLRRETAKFTPEKIEITGPRQEVERLHAAIKNNEQPFRVTVALRPTDKNLSEAVVLKEQWQKSLKATGSTISMRVTQKTERFVLNVPVGIYDRALPAELRGKYRIQSGEEVRQITLEAGGPVLLDLRPEQSKGPDALDRWARENIALIVFLQPSDARQETLPREASLVFFGGLRDRVETSDYNVTDGALVTLTRTP